MCACGIPRNLTCKSSLDLWLVPLPLCKRNDLENDIRVGVLSKKKICFFRVPTLFVRGLEAALQKSPR